VRRYLAHEPIGARPDSFGYRAAKFVRRHRTGVALAGMAAVAAIAGVAAILWQATEARRQRDAAEAQLARATASSEFLGFLLNAAAPAGKTFNAADLLAEGETVVEKQFPEDDPLRAELLASIGKQHISGQRWDQALPVLERAEKAASRSNDPALRARARCPLALALVVSGKPKEGEAMVERALADLPRDSRHALARAECLARWSEFAYYTDEGESAVRHATEALAALSQSSVPSLLLRHDAMGNLAYGYYLVRQNAKADAAFAELMRELEETGRDRTLIAADVWNNWALVHHRGDIRKAEPLYRRSLELHRSLEGEEGVSPGTLHNYAGVLQMLARYDEAEPYFQEAIRKARSREVVFIEIFATLELAELYAVTDRLPEARAALATLDSYLGTKAFTPLRRAHRAYTLGVLAAIRRDFPEARTQFAEAVRLHEGMPAKFTSAVLSLVGLARAELATGHPEKAEDAARRALALAESFVDKDSPSYLVGMSLASLGEVERSTGRAEAGQATLQKAIRHLDTTLGPEHPATREARQALS
jgi:serine/threonine-protein kinase